MKIENQNKKVHIWYGTWKSSWKTTNAWNSCGIDFRTLPCQLGNVTGYPGVFGISNLIGLFPRIFWKFWAQDHPDLLRIGRVMNENWFGVDRTKTDVTVDVKVFKATTTFEKSTVAFEKAVNATKSLTGTGSGKVHLLLPSSAAVADHSWPVALFRGVVVDTAWNQWACLRSQTVAMYILLCLYWVHMSLPLAVFLHLGHDMGLQAHTGTRYR